MMIARGDSTFEVTICATEGEWEGRIVEYHIARMTPTIHVRHNWLSAAAALSAVQRRWRRLFPDEPLDEMPDFAEALVAAPPAPECAIPQVGDG